MLMCVCCSGGHINPAVSFAMFLVGKISFVRGILYIVFQVGSTIITAQWVNSQAFAASADVCAPKLCLTVVVFLLQGTQATESSAHVSMMHSVTARYVICDICDI